jgi:ATP-dependent RNA helicase RhlE
MAVLTRLKYAEDPMRVLILVPDKDRVIALVEKFKELSSHMNIRTIGLYAGHGIEGQKDDLAEGVDIAIGTPDRVQSIYYQAGLNINKLKMFILDDAHLIVQQGFQTIVTQLSESLPKCQHLVFTEVYHTKLETLVTPFLNFPTLIEGTSEPKVKLDIIDQRVYEVPNYKTKLNLLNYLMGDADRFPKVVLFANTHITVSSLNKTLAKRLEGQVCVLKPAEPGSISVKSIQEFIDNPNLRIMIVSNELGEKIDIVQIPCILHFDIPTIATTFVDRILKSSDQKTLSISFATDIELTQVRRIENITSHKFPVEELPGGLIIEGDRKSHKGENVDLPKEDPTKGKAFHEKKESNAKTFNYKFKDRLKMYGKKNRKNKKGE